MVMRLDLSGITVFNLFLLILPIMSMVRKKNRKYLSGATRGHMMETGLSPLTWKINLVRQERYIVFPSVQKIQGT